MNRCIGISVSDSPIHLRSDSPAGAFHMSKPSDLIPELQGRFPIRVELDPLGKDEFVRILTEPHNALTKQYTALLATENVTIDFKKDTVEEIAGIAATVNKKRKI